MEPYTWGAVMEEAPPAFQVFGDSSSAGLQEGLQCCPFKAQESLAHAHC